MNTGSFTERILTELAPYPPLMPCCRAALVEGMRLTGDGDIVTSRLVAARAALNTLHVSGISAHVERRVMPRQVHYRVSIAGGEDVGEASEQPCCSRSRLRGAFLAAGRANRPEVAPHIEIDCRTEAGACRLAADAAALGIVAHVAWRRGRALVLVRATDSVAALLSSIGAQGGRLDFETGRVVHDVRNQVNRRLNGETANLRRLVGAGVRQAAVAQALLGDETRFASLPPALREAAELRLRFPAESLAHLAREAGCSRSAMAGRLHRLVEGYAVTQSV